MSKKNIQELTKDMIAQSQGVIRKLKDIQDSVRIELGDLRKQSDILEKRKRDEQALKEDIPMPKDRLTAYTMPDDPEIVSEIKASAPVSTAKKPAAKPDVTQATKKTIIRDKKTEPVSTKKPETITSKTVAAKPLVARQPAVKPTATKPATKPTAIKPTAVKPTANKPAVNKPAATKPTTASPRPKTAPAFTKPDAKKAGADNRSAPPPKRANTRRNTGYGNNRYGYQNRRNKRRKPKSNIEPIVIDHAVINTEMITIKTLSEKLGKPASDIIKKLLMVGIMVNINQEIDFDTAELIASEYGITVEHDVAKTAEAVMLEDAEVVDEDELLVSRPPVVTIMGHVDHGKTSLLDAYRKSSVTSGEAGGITQHIGAYTVNIDGKDITFLDTPGHEAFTAMRARGAQSTDIAVLVVAADDGVMPQTIEAINHAKAAGVPIIVAVNKIDKPYANPQRILQQLAEQNVVVEEWGGDVISVPVSAKTGENLDKLLEMILLVSEVEDLKANPKRDASGLIIEAKLDRGRGPVATVLVKNGTLKVGDNLIAGTSYGRVRAMYNDKGEKVENIMAGYAVEILGLNVVPNAGDLFHVVDADRIRGVADERKDKIKADRIQATNKVSLDNLFEQIAEGQMKELNIIVKADTQGSVEAVQQSMEKLGNEEVRVRAIHGGVGAITENDVMFASASNAIIIGFNVRPEPLARDLAEKEKVDMRLYRVIYSAIEDIEAAMKGILEPKFKEVELGSAEVRDVFKVTGVGSIGGSYVLNGKIMRNAEIRVVRDGIVVHEGKISSLKRFKDDVKEVNTNYECGIGIENYNDIKSGDIIECFEMVEIKD